MFRGSQIRKLAPSGPRGVVGLERVGSELSGGLRGSISGL
jgi:hypothetical protein